jgi:hypothetical protein
MSRVRTWRSNTAGRKDEHLRRKLTFCRGLERLAVVGLRSGESSLSQPLEIIRSNRKS